MKENKIIFATKNKGKSSELIKLLQKNNIQVSLLSLNNLNDNIEINENGKSFIENALIKATTIFEKYKLPVIADDSGLIVEEINEPGIFSARYAGLNASDTDNNLKLIERIKSLSNRKAYFECALIFIDKNKKIYKSIGRCYGEIIEKPRGNNGFGYDPIFFIPEFNKTMAELTIEEKNRISHRAKAFNKLIEILRGIYG